MAQKFEIGMLQQVADVAFAAGEEIINANNLIVIRKQSFAQMGAEESGPAGDQNAFAHSASSYHHRCLGNRKEFFRHYTHYGDKHNSFCHAVWRGGDIREAYRSG
jgi:hypothetical protein